MASEPILLLHSFHEEHCLRCTVQPVHLAGKLIAMIRFQQPLVEG